MSTPLPIRVSEITLLHVSHGLYKSTASVFKEIASNAYDADATNIRIDTNYPYFNFFSCQDNGTGMTKEDFIKYFYGKGIGTCTKRRKGNKRTGKYKRPIIGKLGIGMLSVGQLCHSFIIESHYIDKKDGKGKAYRAEIVIRDSSLLTEDQLLESTGKKPKDIVVGTFRFDDEVHFDNDKIGFRIFSKDIRRSYRDEMKEGLDEIKYKKYFDYKKINERYFKKIKKSARSLKPYLESLWELSTLCAIPYDEDDLNLLISSVKGKQNDRNALILLRQKQRELVSKKFSVVVDGIELRKPLAVSHCIEGACNKIYFFSFNKTVFDAKLDFNGYIYAQIRKAIIPLEMNGIQIRIKNIGIGGYDSTFLNYYKQIETIRNKWITGEIFVKQGLETALNIDRDSFNEHDEHYKAIRDEIHERLDVIFKDVESIARQQRASELQATIKNLTPTINTIARKNHDVCLTVQERNLGKQADLVKVDGDVLVINNDRKVFRKKRDNDIYKYATASFYLANTIKDNGKRAKFYNQLIKTIIEEIL